MNNVTPRELLRVLPDSEKTQHLKNLEIYGYTKISGMMTPETLERLKQLTEAHYKKTSAIQYAGRPVRDARDKMVYNLHMKDKFFIDVLEDPFIQSILMEHLNDPYHRFLPAEVPNYILGYYNARSSGEKLDLHIDSYIPVPGPRTWSMQTAYVLEDQATDNGSTTVVPGSHLQGNFTDRELQNIQPIYAKAGDVVLWDSRLWHGTLENVSGRSRWSLIATFTSWWVKPSMDVTRSLSDDMYQTLSNSQKALLGFCSIPPKDEHSRINTKTGYDALLPSVKDYYK